MKRATMDDVARRAGVSRQTVSRVLNERRLVTEKTLFKVQQAIQELDFRRNSAARSLVSRKTHQIGVISTNFSGFIYARNLEGIESGARESGYQTMITAAHRSDIGEPESSPMLLERHLDGILINYHGSSSDTFRILDEIPTDIPIVSTGYAPCGKQVKSITINNAHGARIAVSHLVDSGALRIGMITGPRRDNETLGRSGAYAAVLDERGIDFSDRLLSEGDWSVSGGFIAAERLLDSGECFDAVFAQSDSMAVGCLRALHRRGIRVPQDVLLAGFNDIPAARYIEPSITTVHNPAFRLGRVCADTLISLINSEEADLEHPELNPELVIRESAP